MGSLTAAEMSRMPGRRQCEVLDTGQTQAEPLSGSLKNGNLGSFLRIETKQESNSLPGENSLDVCRFSLGSN
jgi:hypothetical protein